MPTHETPELTGSWRNFSPKLDPETAEIFRSIEEATLESLRQAGREARLKEEAAHYQTTPDQRA